MSNMKIILIQNILAPYRIPLFEALSKVKGYKLMVLLSAKTENRRSWIIDFNKITFAYKFVKGITLKVSYEREIQININFLVEFIKHSPNVIICSGYSFSTLMALFYKAINKRVKIIIWTEAYEHENKLLRKMMVKFTDAFLVGGILASERVVELGAEKRRLYTAYNCVETNKYAMTDGKSFKECDKTILYVGRLVYSKGVWDLVKAFEIYQNKSKDSKLILLGDGPIKEELESYCTEKSLNCTFEGFIQQNKIYPYYSEADIFVLCSHHDNNPLVLLEALASGLPIVVSDAVGSVNDVVKQGINGYSFPDGDINELSKIFIKVLGNSNLQKKLSEGAKITSKNFTVEKTLQSFVNCINDTQK